MCMTIYNIYTVYIYIYKDTFISVLYYIIIYIYYIIILLWLLLLCISFLQELI